MCGIVGYVGKKEANGILLDGLEALEYRGYDSAGVYLPEVGSCKAVGPVKNLRTAMAFAAKQQSGIAHTRWATHGKPSEANAHPHTGTGKVWAVHNGIIENHDELRRGLEKLGRKFSSQTDTEVIPHLVEMAMEAGATFEEAVFDMLPKLKGTYGLALMHADKPDFIVAARMGSPLVIGVAKDGRLVSSDTAPIVRHTREVVYMRDGDIAFIEGDSHQIFSIHRERLPRKNESIPHDIDSAQKGGYAHFMEKEIMESPDVVRNALRGRIVLEEGKVKLGGLERFEEKLSAAKRIVLVGCGTSYYAALVGKYLIEDIARIPVDAEIGSELRYRNAVFVPGTVLVALSQSGETADTLEAVREAKRKGAFTIGIVNVVGSSIARETDAGIYNHAGPEVSVASTKAFVSQVTALAMLAVFLGTGRDLNLSERKALLSELSEIPNKIEAMFIRKDEIRRIAQKYASAPSMLYIGRKYMFPLAYEGALKLKEISYIHAEAHGAGELKHGPLALISEGFPVVALAPKGSVYEKTISNIQEAKARGADVIVVASEGDRAIGKLANEIIRIPKVDERLAPILAAVPLQLFAYYAALSRGHNVDRPRNLAKSVTVE
ncbi:MAG TPA: glutamine--fructose-6-phosphate transaminase (isomerizing) [Candidatus Paceibacterota bacterium]|nr:glutamine--fructose-6-phosphate transaminase (isomerizing) [Candidatus Paceibacterota bacterium]